MIGEPNTIPVQNIQPVATQPASPATSPVPRTPTAQPVTPLPIEPKKSIFKTWWLWTIIGIIIIGLIIGGFLLISGEARSSIENSTNGGSVNSNNEGQATLEPTQIREICQEAFTGIRNILESSCGYESLEEAHSLLTLEIASLLEEDRENCLGDLENPLIIFEEKCNISDTELYSLLSPTNCLDIQSKLSISVNSGFTWIDQENNAVSVQVERKNSSVTLLGMEIILIGANDSIAEKWTEELPFNGGAAVQTFSGKDFNYINTKQISIAAIVTLRGERVTCEVSNIIETSSL